MIKNLAILFLLFSCSTPKLYRATVGISSNSTNFKAITEDDDGVKDERSLCVESVSTKVDDPKECDGGGFEEDSGVGFLDPWVEFKPHYFRDSDFGLSYFFSFNRSSTTLLDYPIVGEKTDISIDRISFNPIIYYNIGDKYISDKGGISFRVGFGAALNYVYDFSITRQSTGEENEVDTKFKPGYAIFVEFNWNWLTVRVENSQIEYEGRKFDGVESDTLRIENNKGSFYYSYYF